MLAILSQLTARLSSPGLVRIFSVAAATATCLAFLAPVVAGTAPDPTYVVDQDADPDGWGGNTGAVFIYEGTTGTGWAASPDFVDPIAAVADPNGNLFILDAGADPLGTGSPAGAVFRYEAQGGVSLFAASEATRNLTDVALHADGRLFLTGLAAPSQRGQSEGAVFEVDAAGAITVFVQSPMLSEPTGVAVDAAGALIVVDRSAVPPGSEGVGAVFRVTTPGGALDVVATSPLFADLADVAVAADGNSYLVVDAAADPDSAGLTGAVFRVTPAGAVTVVATDLRFARPREAVALDDASLLLIDSDAVPDGGSQPGAVFRISPAGEVSVELLAEPAWQTAVGLAVDSPVGRTVSGDLDGDGDVDLDDFSRFAACYNGSNRPLAVACPVDVDADLDDDNDVDLDDFSIFAANYTGSL